ncbi:hypothetical protein AOLI_G00196240 [Acnodon oligacanthus]
MLYWGFSPTKERPEVPRMKCAVDLQGTKETLLLGYGASVDLLPLRQLQRPLPEEGGAHKGCRHLEPNTGEEDQAKQQVDEGRGRRGRKANKTGHYAHTVKDQHAEDCVSPLPLF